MAGIEKTTNLADPDSSLEHWLTSLWESTSIWLELPSDSVLASNNREPLLGHYH